MDNSSKTRIKEALNAYREATRSMKIATIAFINSIEEIPVERKGNCFTVSFSTIQENGGILSPFYYDVKKQKETLIDIVENTRDIDFIKILTEIAENGKRTVRCGNTSFQQIFAPSVVEALKNFIKEEEMYA